MKECLYLVADSLAHNWRQIGLKLGLSLRNVLDIEGRCVGRPREKCMIMLYKWRIMVPLQEYKVTSIIQALRECGHQQMASK